MLFHMELDEVLDHLEAQIKIARIFAGPGGLREVPNQPKPTTFRLRMGDFDIRARGPE
jgi:hypothetical protein